MADAEVTCGEGTALVDTVCVPVDGAVTCGEGTQRAGGECLPSDSLVCGAGTMRTGDECLPLGIVTCGEGTTLKDGYCVAESTLICGDGTQEEDGECVPVDIICGPGTRLDGELCVGSVTPVSTSVNFQFSIAEKGATGIVYFLDSEGTAVHRYDLIADGFLTPFTIPGDPASKMAVTASGDAIYVGTSAGRIDELDAADGGVSFLTATASTLWWMTVVEDFLFTIDDSGAWETHSMFDRSTGELVFSDDWRNRSNGAAYAPGIKKLFTFRDGSSPNDIYFTNVDTSTGQLGVDTESPYHGDYTLGHPIRVSLDEERVFVASGAFFNTNDLTYAGAIGFAYLDLAFHGERLYLLRNVGGEAQLIVLTSDFDVVETIAIAGTPLRLFVHDGELTVFTRQENISAWSEDL